MVVPVVGIPASAGIAIRRPGIEHAGVASCSIHCPVSWPSDGALVLLCTGQSPAESVLSNRLKVLS